MGTGLAAKYEIIQSISNLSCKFTKLYYARSLCDDHQALKEFHVIFYHFQDCFLYNIEKFTDQF